MSVQVTYGKGYSPSLTSDGYVLARRKDKPHGKPIIALHGANNTSDTTWLPWHSHNFGGCMTNLLAQEGYTFLAIDDAGAETWGDDAAMGRIDDAVTFLAGMGIDTTKVGLMGWSMGGINALNWIKRNPTKVACAWLAAPLTNLDYAESTVDPTNVDAAYGGAASYAANSAGHKVYDEPQSFRGVCPIHIVHAINDAVLPIQQSRDFVANVNDPLVTLEEVDTGASAGHYAVFMPVTDAEVAQFYRAHLGAP